MPTTATTTVIPSRYVLRYSYTHCANCSRTTPTSAFFALSFIRPRNGVGTTVKHYEPCARPMFNLPVEHVSDPPLTTAFCVLCPKVDLSHLPPPPSAARVYDLAEPTIRSRPTPAKPPTPPRKPTLEELA